MEKRYKYKKQKGFIDISIVFLIFIMSLVMFINILPAYIVKMELINFANEIARVIEIEGEVGEKVDERINELIETTNFNPTIDISKSGKLDINEEFTVTTTYTIDIGNSSAGSFPITLTGKASGRSEVYWKE